MFLLFPRAVCVNRVLLPLRSAPDLSSNYSISPCSVPVVNVYGMTGKLSRGNELPNSFMDRSRWLGFYENVLQDG